MSLIFFKLCLIFCLTKLTLNFSHRSSLLDDLIESKNQFKFRRTFPALKYFNFLNFVKETIPLSDNRLNEYLDNLEQYNFNPDCFKSESCAHKWIDDYNYLNAKLNEKSAFLGVS